MDELSLLRAVDRLLTMAIFKEVTTEGAKHITLIEKAFSNLIDKKALTLEDEQHSDSAEEKSNE